MEIALTAEPLTLLPFILIKIFMNVDIDIVSDIDVDIDIVIDIDIDNDVKGRVHRICLDCVREYSALCFRQK